MTSQLADLTHVREASENQPPPPRPHKEEYIACPIILPVNMETQ